MFRPGRAELAREGDYLSIISIGNMLEIGLKIADAFQENGVYCEVINCRSLKPIDKETLIKSIKKTNRVVVLEDNSEVGGLSSVVLGLLAEAKLNPEILSFGYPDSCIVHGSKSEVSRQYCMDFESIYEKIVETWGD